MIKTTVAEVVIMENWMEYSRFKTKFLTLNVGGLHYEKMKNSDMPNMVQVREVQVQVNTQPTPLKKMSVESEIKILICDMNNITGSRLQCILVENKFKNVVFQPDITELKKQVYYYKPDVLISGNHLWEDIPGINFVTKLPLPHDAHVVVWSDNLTEKILLLQFNKPKLHFVKKTNHPNELIETIRKVKSTE